MTDKLQELTERLYNEGLSKGKSEGEAIVKEATKKAEEIISEARSKASSIIGEAEKKAEEMKAKAESDVKMASAQAMQATKNEIGNLLLNASVTDKTSEAVKDSDFLKTIIKTVAGKFSASEGVDIGLVLPEKLKGDLEEWVSGELASTLNCGVSASFSKKINGGFTIGPMDGKWFVSLTEESFNALFAEYLRPVTRKLLFGE